MNNNMKSIKIWSALLLLVVSLGLLKFAYVTSNWHLAVTALILGALFVLTGLSMATDREDKRTILSNRPFENPSKEEWDSAMRQMQCKEPSFKEKKRIDEIKSLDEQAEWLAKNGYKELSKTMKAVSEHSKIGKPKLARKTATIRNFQSGSNRMVK